MNADGACWWAAHFLSHPPGAKSAPPHPAPSAFIFAFRLPRALRSEVGDEPAKAYKAGEGFYEMPGSHHRISENASDKEPASLLAVFVVDSKDKRSEEHTSELQ